ncbi:aspartyl/asparaginyl beta-hydroxylase domain-containing protein [Sodalis ligni]|uniref:Beta-hydroxylase n=1 Tax=Sodalis ligni TaxID=2697027 RepID=A0A4R1NFG0_9GAMM|nr:aspartyl/asparaginyl beta-hydroxylase domain-containing protein [Sodalis ligni]TCL06262.1 beta-hydroxylase [Sodalis ligni]
MPKSKPTSRSLLRRSLIKIGKHLLRWNGRFQTRHSLISTTPHISNKEFDWTARLENAWPEIRAELDHLLEHPEDIPSFHQISPDQKRISKGDNWKTFGMYVFGKRIEQNCRLCPRTAEVISTIPGMYTAMFSILKPHYHIVPHKGPTRAVVRAHLGIKVPKNWQNVWIRVHDQVLHWQEGKVLLFDDSYEHEVLNDTDEMRAVLFLDVIRPMDRIGTLFNRVLFALMKASPYVKQPIKNLSAWNRKDHSGLT